MAPERMECCIRVCYRVARDRSCGQTAAEQQNVLLASVDRGSAPPFIALLRPAYGARDARLLIASHPREHSEMEGVRCAPVVRGGPCVRRRGVHACRRG